MRQNTNKPFVDEQINQTQYNISSCGFGGGSLQGPFCRQVFDCTLLLMVSHWFPDTLHTVSLLFYCILCPGLVGDGGDRGCSQSHLPIKLFHTGYSCSFCVKQTDQQVNLGQWIDWLLIYFTCYILVITTRVFPQETGKKKACYGAGLL